MKKSEKKRLEKQIKLQKQAEADRYRASRLKRENDALRDRIKVYAEGLNQLDRAMDAVLVEVAVKFGEKTEDGWKFAIPAPDTKKLRDYEIQTVASDDRKTFTTKVREAKHEADDQGDAAGAE